MTRIGATVLGYPRIGSRRELKRAVEAYWAGKSSVDELTATAAQLRASTWQDLARRGLDSVPGNTFSYYDHVLDTAVLFGAVPERFRGLSELDTYFAMARGRPDIAPLELTKWFDTNYHYLVPELAPDTQFALVGDKPVAEFEEAARLGVRTRPVVLGPLTFLLLAKPARVELAGALTECYVELLERLAKAGAHWVQLDEPAFCADRSPAELSALRDVYTRLAAATERPNLLVAGYFGDFGPALPILAESGVEGVAVDLVSAPDTDVSALRGKTVVAGVVDGRNVWATDPNTALSRCAAVAEVAGDLSVSTSCSLLHVPYDVEVETEIDPTVRARLAFARQKVDEVVHLNGSLGAATQAPVPQQTRPVRQHAPQRERAQREHLDLPLLATTTIGSFPQTADVRRARADLRAGRLSEDEYKQRMRAEIERVIRLQEQIGLDVLVHGEPERNDMVQYFAEHLDGFAATQHGWVQSYGSRCVRPPILHGDVSRPAPITVEWSSYAQSLTDKPVKGMLTGPVTILAWSFVRVDQPLADTADQVAHALRDEVRDLEQAGIRIVQVDEPALRELLPLRVKDRKEYLDWAVGAFRLATGAAAPTTQIHTHLCYSEFGDVIEAIDGLDADVTTIEAARSHMEVLDDLRATGFDRGIGPGVYDIHSSRVPSVDEIAERLKAALCVVPAERLWVNPDCGLKTRTYAEVESALRNMVQAAAKARHAVS